MAAKKKPAPAQPMLGGMAPPPAKKSAPVEAAVPQIAEPLPPPKVATSNAADRALHAMCHVLGNERACHPACYWVAAYGAPLPEDEFRTMAAKLGRRWSSLGRASPAK
jgi:hypothetical protein